ncbi:phage tail protein [Clostridium gasigenes]|uniref:phage tail spike protein n=1 Tax=Clostridium gasigenes TaxID=94869 RepID=UPI00162681ED|nr:phage tail spike protein [Clostridium gasigenes]MBB6622573.1 phage tail protein [Clostridium gasigenes]
MQLYKASNINFNFNGDFNLDNIIFNHTFTGGINKIWGIEVEIKFDKEEKWRNISQYDILKCDTPMLKDQLFRIFDVNADDGNLVINARLLFYDLSKTIILDSRNVMANGQEAIDKALKGTLYTGHSNISTRQNCNWIKKNIVNALMGNEDYSFASNYNGELWIDNFNITLQDSIGGDYGVQCTYGKDIESIEKTINTDSVFTRLIPYGNNNLMLDEIYVDSPLINNYPIIQEKEISFDDVKIKEKPEDEEGFNTKSEAQAELRKRCHDLFASGLDKPLANFKVSIISLENTEEYKDFKDLVNIGLGDTVRIYYKPLGIDLNTRCISLKWDGISKKYLEVELGNYMSDFNDIVSDISNKATNANNKIESITDGDNIIAEKVKGFLDATKTSLKASKTIADKQDYRIALAEDLDPSSPTFGSMLWGSGKIFLADKRTLDGKDWDYSTAITPKGIVADLLIGKLLASVDGSNYFDLETGIIKGKDLMIDLTRGVLNFKNGLIEGKDLSIDLGNGIVDFRRGLIRGANSSWDLDTGEIKGKDLKIDLEKGIIDFRHGLIKGENSSWDLDTGLIKGKDLSINLEKGILNFVRGLIKGNNLSIDLDTGIVNFNKGKIEGLNLKMNLDNGIITTVSDIDSSKILEIGNGKISSNGSAYIEGKSSVTMQIANKSSISVYDWGAYISGDKINIVSDNINLVGNVNITGTLTVNGRVI